MRDGWPALTAWRKDCGRFSRPTTPGLDENQLSSQKTSDGLPSGSWREARIRGMLAVGVRRPSRVMLAFTNASRRAAVSVWSTR